MPTDTLHATITLADGRRIAVLAEGPEDGIPLVRHHGTPGGGLVPYPPMTETELARGFRSIHLARPGYSQSTPRPGRRVADVAGDVAEILDALGAGTFLTIGWSGGGPHALACAALLPGRCLAAASVAGVAPREAAGLDWLAGMGPENIEEFRAAEAGPAELTAFLEKDAAGLGSVTGASIIEGLGGLIGDADKAVLTGEYADYMAASLHASVDPGLAAGSRTTWRSWPAGVSRSARTRPRSPSGRAMTIAWSRSAMASGSPPTSRVRRPTCCPAKVTSACR